MKKNTELRKFIQNQFDRVLKEKLIEVKDILDKYREEPESERMVSFIMRVGRLLGETYADGFLDCFFVNFGSEDQNNKFRKIRDLFRD